MSDASRFAAGLFFVVVCFVGAFLIGYDIGKSHGVRAVQNEAVEKGYAEYNSGTGVWQWKEHK